MRVRGLVYMAEGMHKDRAVVNTVRNILVLD
jgi:hypothetical protein